MLLNCKLPISCIYGFVCWWCSNGKKQSPNPYQVQLFPVPWMTLSNNPDLQRNPTYNHTRHHILSALWWREQRFPFNRLNNRPRLHRASAVMWIRARSVSGNGFKVLPWAALWKPFHMGEGFEKKSGRRKHRDPFEITFTCCCATWEERRGSFCEHLTKPTEIHTPLSFLVYMHENSVEETF